MADQKSELTEIKIMGGKPQKNSGRGLHQKGDAVLEPFCVDVKECGSSFTLSRKVWVKVTTDATKHKKEPALMVAIGENPTTRVWVISDDMFEEMREAWLEKYG